MKETAYTIYSPPLERQKLPNFDPLVWLYKIQPLLKKANEQYLHWDKLQYKNWIPKDLFPNKKIFWTLVKQSRQFGSITTPIKDAQGKYFSVNTNFYNEFLHIVDKEMAGNFMGITDLSESDKKQFITRNIIEESIASSQLEGANTSRAVAKKMLLEGRKPHGHGEQMIVNNHNTMLQIEQKFCKENLSWDLICELHRMITYKTIAQERQGKLRETFDDNHNRLVIKPWDDLRIAYIAPDKEFVEAELPSLIDFANDRFMGSKSNNVITQMHGELFNIDFIHPVIKAIMIHFWVGLLHPFEDGNGRLARILFYWYLLKHDYWAFAYLSLSEKIKKSPEQYAMAYIYSEQDDCDLTYFVNYNINKLMLAREDFQIFLQKKISENREVISLTQQKYNFNERQIKLLQYLHKKIENRTNIAAHQQLYSIKKVTAITDLKVLVENGFLYKRKIGRNIYYYPTEKIAKLF